jgi:hypothetical protein
MTGLPAGDRTGAVARRPAAEHLAFAREVVASYSTNCWPNCVASCCAEQLPQTMSPAVERLLCQSLDEGLKPSGERSLTDGRERIVDS